MSNQFQCNNCNKSYLNREKHLQKLRSCEYCKKEFCLIAGTKGRFCSRTCASLREDKLHIIHCQICDIDYCKVFEEQHLKRHKNCLCCEKLFFHKPNCEGLYCSHSCSAKNTNSKSKMKHGRYSKEYKNKHISKCFKCNYPHTRIYGYRNCNCCNKGFWALTKDQVNCSKDCARKSSTYMKHTIKYKHNNEIILLDSTWELKIAEYLDKLNIKWIRPKHLVWYDSNDKLRRFYPDFYLEDYNVYIDPKNDYRIIQDKEKLEYFKDKIELYYGRVDYLKNIIYKKMEGKDLELSSWCSKHHVLTNLN